MQFWILTVTIYHIPSLSAAGTLRASRSAATQQARSAPACAPGDDYVDFAGAGQTDPEPASASEAKAAFLKLLDAGPVEETLLVNRHRCCRVPNRTLTAPRAMRMFDWQLLHQGEANEVSAGSPRSVYCKSDFAEECMSATARLPPLSPGEERVLALGNEDTLLSKNRDTVQRMLDSGRFSRVLYESKDIDVPGVGVLPQGLSNFYLARSDVGPAMEQIRGASLGQKTGAVLAAWGAVWSLKDRIESRKQADDFAKTSCLAPRRMLQSDEYWRELARHRFLLAPSGHGVQCSKVAEALLVLTVPIVQRVPDGGVWDELRDVYGWPLAIVDRWDEITPQNLRAWWHQLSPRLHEARLRLTPERWFAQVMRSAAAAH